MREGSDSEHYLLPKVQRILGPSEDNLATLLYWLGSEGLTGAALLPSILEKGLGLACSPDIFPGISGPTFSRRVGKSFGIELGIVSCEAIHVLPLTRVGLQGP